MSSQDRKRRKRYLEPGAEYVVPRQTLWRQGKISALAFAPGNSDGASRNQPLRESSDMQSSNDEAYGQSSDDSSIELESGHQGQGVPDVNREVPFDTQSSDDDDGNPELSDDERQDSARFGAVTAAASEDLGEDEFTDDDMVYLEETYGRYTLPGQRTTQAQALLLILAYVVSAGLSWQQIDGLLRLINVLFGEDVAPRSKYLFRKIWKHTQKEMVDIHFFCEKCHDVLEVHKMPYRQSAIRCSRCDLSSTTTSLVLEGSFFITFSLKKQLQILMNCFRDTLQTNLEKIAQMSSDEGLGDIEDGSIIRETRIKYCCKPHDLTVSFSTDGSAPFNSSPSSMWPIHVMVNELPVTLRFQNLLLCGLWFGQRKPDMFVFLSAFVDRLLALGPIMWKCCRTGRNLYSRVYAVCCIADAPARASVLHRKQFNGYFGCPWCYQKGTLVDGLYLHYI